MGRDNTRQIPHSKTAYLWRTDTKFKCPVDRLNLLCCDAASGLDTVSLFRHQASGRVTPRLPRSLWNRNRGVYSTFLVSVFHLPLSSFVVGQFGESLTNTNLTAGRLRSHWTMKTLVQTRMGDMMEMIPDGWCSIWLFPNKVHRSSRNKFCWMQNKLYFPRSNLPI